MARNPVPRKRPVNLTLDETLVVQARDLTDNLSGVAESSLTDFVRREHAKRAAHARALHATIATWNEFNENFGSFADEHSTL
jgi:antitoxin CcdA